MTGALAALMPCGTRLHLQHGPIDLIVGAEGPGPAQQMAFTAAHDRFGSILDELVAELPLLRTPLGAGVPPPVGRIARHMAGATAPFAALEVTPMAAVAGSVADTVLNAMRAATPLTRAYVNNGGDIALHLAPGARFRLAMARHDGADLGRIDIAAAEGIGGIATSGCHGRSHSLGIADSVTVLTRTAAGADAAATMIANAVDLPDHPAVTRVPAHNLDPDSDLGARPVVTAVGPLTAGERRAALAAGLVAATRMGQTGLIAAAALTLGPETVTFGTPFVAREEELAHV